VGCGDSRCTDGAFECTATTVPTFCCGDAVCGGLEENCLGCGIDCTAPPPTNACLAFTCGDGVCDEGEDCKLCRADCLGQTKGAVSGRYCCGDGTAQPPEGDGAICDDNF
jgi:hypothetical protein